MRFIGYTPASTRAKIDGEAHCRGRRRTRSSVMCLGLHLVAPGILASGCASGTATASTPNQAQREPTKLPQDNSPALRVDPQRTLSPAWVPPDADATQVFLEVGAIGTEKRLRWRI